MQFVIAPIDAEGIVVLGIAKMVYFATMTHHASRSNMTCTVKYSAITDIQEGECDIPSLLCTDAGVSSNECDMSPPVGEFSLEVKDAQGMLVGATWYTFFVENCPESYYHRDGTCSLCPSHVECDTGSSIADWRLDEGYWRAGEPFIEVLECRFGKISCPGGAAANPASGRDAYCAPQFVGPLCSQCADDHFLSWAGDGDCHECDAGKSHIPTIGLASGVLVLCTVFASALYKCRNRKNDSPNPETNSPPSTFASLQTLFLMAKVKIFTLFLVSQVGRSRRARRPARSLTL